MRGSTADQHGRWTGRNPDKDSLREEIWGALEASRHNVGPVWSRIPNFVGAAAAAARLAELPIWKAANVVKCNPDPPQIPVRLRALHDGKLLYTPVPELSKGFPFVLLDPAKLEKNKIQFELAATSQGAVEHGEPVSFADMAPMDFVVVGCVGVTRKGGRTGKGGGFADLELGIFRELGKISPATPIATTVHPTQIVADDRILMLEHDSALDWIVTENEAIETHTPYRQPDGVAWDVVQQDQLDDIPFLKELRAEILARRAR
jgi:5-formyltetrahydrofolate cyclo-ligase